MLDITLKQVFLFKNCRLEVILNICTVFLNLDGIAWY